MSAKIICDKCETECEEGDYCHHCDETKVPPGTQCEHCEALIALGVLYKDAFLLPAMGIFILIAGYGFWRQQQQKQ